YIVKRRHAKIPLLQVTKSYHQLCLRQNLNTNTAACAHPFEMINSRFRVSAVIFLPARKVSKSDYELSYPQCPECWLEVAACDNSPAIVVLTSLYATCSESVRHPGGDMVDVSAWTRLFEEPAGKEMRVDAHQRRVAIELPLGLHCCLTADQARVARQPGADQVDSGFVNPILGAFAPKKSQSVVKVRLLVTWKSMRGWRSIKFAGPIKEISPIIGASAAIRPWSLAAT